MNPPMAKRVNTESTLPEPLIQYIQSFLSGKEAAQTTVLSKSWYDAWLTRPNLDFDLSDFHQLIYGNPETNRFSLYTRRTLQRYLDLKLKIQSFKLKIKGWERAGYALAHDLMVKAVKAGATDLDFELTPPTVTFSFPSYVLGSESLTRLSIVGCKIEGLEKEKVRCSGLKALFLQEVWLEGDMIFDVLSSCPLIEDLVVIECKSFFKVEDFRYSTYVTTKSRMLALSPSNEIENPNLGRGINPFELHKLKSLYLEKVKISGLFFDHFSSKFPCLTNLDVHYCSGYKEIQICSPSLEFITFAQKSSLKAKFDVPSIRKFRFSGHDLLPTLAFQTTSTEWESDISLCSKRPSYPWFLNLNKLLTSLSSSTIYLSLDLQCGERNFDFTGEIEGLPVVQNLTMRASDTVCENLMNGIFWSCRPIFITHHRLPSSAERTNEDLLALLFKTFSPEAWIRNSYLIDLIDVSVVEVSLPSYERTIRFQLRWKQESYTFI